MSYYEDFECYYPEELLDEYFAEKQIYYDIEEKARSKIWTTKDGTKIPVKDMTDSHIQNIINLIKRKDKRDYYLPWLKVFEEELENRALF